MCVGRKAQQKQKVNSFLLSSYFLHLVTGQEANRTKEGGTPDPVTTFSVDLHIHFWFCLIFGDKSGCQVSVKVNV